MYVYTKAVSRWIIQVRFLSEHTGLHLEGISSQRRGELRNTWVQFRTALSPGVPYNRAGSPEYKTEIRGPVLLGSIMRNRQTSRCAETSKLRLQL